MTEDIESITRRLVFGRKRDGRSIYALRARSEFVAANHAHGLSEKFEAYRFADLKERVTDLLSPVVRVSVETVAIVEAIKVGPR